MDSSKIVKEAKRLIENAKDIKALEEARVKYLGRKAGKITHALRGLKKLSVAERKKAGPKLQALRKELESLLEEKKKSMATSASSADKRVDFSAPAKKLSRGHLHPLTLVEADARRIFAGMNFSVVEGPEVESEYYNFDALNIPKDHPAREMWDTFWLKPESTGGKSQIANRDESRLATSERLLLRTHTSPVQVRHMETHEPPFQIIVPGRVFRYEAIDASHEINFYQLDGLMVGKHVTLANFKYVVEEFFKKFFRGQKIDFRFRPSYFPFTEPSVEVDIKLKGKWLEMMGAGMVHPRVFEYAHYNSRDWRGFAFGVGIERLAMVKYGIPDIRMFYSGDVRLTKQF